MRCGDFILTPPFSEFTDATLEHLKRMTRIEINEVLGEYHKRKMSDIPTEDQTFYNKGPCKFYEGYHSLQDHRLMLLSDTCTTKPDDPLCVSCNYKPCHWITAGDKVIDMMRDICPANEQFLLDSPGFFHGRCYHTMCLKVSPEPRAYRTDF